MGGWVALVLMNENILIVQYQNFQCDVESGLAALALNKD